MIKIVAITFLLCAPTFGYPDENVCRAFCGCYGVNDGSAQQGKPGKAGPPGVPGVQGPPGNQGLPGTNATVDYERLSDLIDEKVNQAMELHKSRVRDCKQEEGLPYGDVCYIAVAFANPTRRHYDAAVQKCRENGGSLAEIHGKIDQKHVEDLARQAIPSSRTYQDFYVGLTFVRSGNHVRLKSGKIASLNQFQWLNRYPLQTPGWPRGSRTKPTEELIIKVTKNPASPIHGLFIWPDPYSLGVICERPL